MTKAPNYAALFARRSMGIRPGLDIVKRVHAALGHPCAGRPVAHIVGTNGKGSVAVMLEHLLRGRGRRTGLFTSPHLQRVSERIRVEGLEVSQSLLDASIEAVLAAEPDDLPRPLSFFEVLTLCTLLVFERVGVDVVVLEAGLGGRLDATRLVTPEVTVVTRIDLDHQAILGDTLAEIAAEKAGAMARGIPVITCDQDPEAMTVLEDHARALGCSLREVEPLSEAVGGFVGAPGRTNAALALVAAGVLGVFATREELLGAKAPGRFEVVPRSPGSIIFDVAHNEASVRALLDTLATLPPAPTLVVSAVSADKNANAIAGLLCGLPGATVWTVADPALELVALPRAEQTYALPELTQACEERLEAGFRVVVCGSHRLVGAMQRAFAGLPPDIDPSEGRDTVFGQ